MVWPWVRCAAAGAAAALLLASGQVPADAATVAATSDTSTEPVPAPVSGLGTVGRHESARVLVIRNSQEGPDVTSLPVTGHTEATASAQAARVEPGVVAVAVDRRVRLLGTADPLRNRQWGMTAVHAERAWRISKGEGVLVAVVDSGVDAGHPDLLGAVTSGFNSRRDRGDWSPATRDRNGHGTHVAGIIAARARNGLGVVGVAPRAQIMPVKVLDAAGTGWISDVVEGVVWATNHGADVINMSLGGPDATFLAEAVRYAVSRGVTVVAAAGNEGSTRPSYPAALPGVISVGAWSEGGPLAAWSNRGSTLDVVAPGTDIWSTVPRGYESMDGTSMASPHVAGVAALIRAENPDADVMGILRATSADRGADGRDDRYGWGLVDAAAAVQRACGCASTAVRAAVPRQTVRRVRDLSVGQTRRLPGHTQQGVRTRWSTRVPAVCSVARHKGRARVTGEKTGDCRLTVRADGDRGLPAMTAIITIQVTKHT